MANPNQEKGEFPPVIERILRWAKSVNAARGVEMGGGLGLMVFGVVFNFMAARHFYRWDWTTGKRYSLTPPTLQTLHQLDAPIDIWVLMGGGEPLLSRGKKRIRG